MAAICSLFSNRVREYSCCILLGFCCLIYVPAHAADSNTALNEIADALIQRGVDGVPYGSLYYRSLPMGEDGKRIVRIYAKPYPRELALANRALWYAMADAAPLSPTMQQWVLQEYNREWSQLRFEVTDDPAQATMFMVEARFVPNAQSGKQRDAKAYYQTAANSMNASVGGVRSALIHFNSIGNPWLRKAIDANQGSVVRATMLNELFNGFAVLDFQELNVAKLSPTTQQWLAAHRARIDDYTVTRSGGPLEDEYLKPLDKILIEKLLQP